MKTVKIFAALAIALAATAARAEDSYLYWMVQNANYNNSAIDFAYATIKAEDGGSYLNLYEPGGATSDINALASTGDGMSSSTDGGAFAKFDYNSATTFLVELWNSDNTVVGWQSYSYDAWKNYVYTSTGAGSASPLTVSEVVPEPTSGLLMLFGLAGLALRRKRRA